MMKLFSTVPNLFLRVICSTVVRAQVREELDTEKIDFSLNYSIDLLVISWFIFFFQWGFMIILKGSFVALGASSSQYQS